MLALRTANPVYMNLKYGRSQIFHSPLHSE
jgi:hypothetical protein